jgi:two-component system KDP operon response regulator KdpE
VHDEVAVADDLPGRQYARFAPQEPVEPVDRRRGPQVDVDQRLQPFTSRHAPEDRQARRYDVVTAADGADALHATASQRPDVVVLDLGLPDMDGVEVIRKLRTWSPVPILILSGRMDNGGKVDALDAGADDYVTKPFNIEELLARIRAVTRRLASPEPPPTVRIGRHTVDVADRRIEGVHLTPIEWHLLEALVRHPGKLVSQRQLLQEVWGPTYQTETEYLRQYMKHLRRKLEDRPGRGT